MKLFLCSAFCATLLIGGEREAVEAVALGYIDAIYQAKPDKIREIAHPEMSKRGFYWDKEGKVIEAKMDIARLEQVARNFNPNAKKDMSKAPHKVEVYDVLSQTASVKVHADWGTDYMLLAKYEGKWMITHVLWQSAR